MYNFNKMKRVAIAIMKQDEYPFSIMNWDEEPLLSEKLIIDELRNHNMTVEPVVWNDSKVNWSLYDLVIVRATYDYAQHPEDFCQWLDNLNKQGILICNSSEIIKWSMHKSYLMELQKKGVLFPKTVVIKKEDISQLNIAEIMQTEVLEKCIVKPCMGVGSCDVFLIESQTQATTMQQELCHLYTDRDVIIQEYIPEITRGEISCYFFGQKFSHAILKVPKEGDFRAVFCFGANILSIHPPPEVLKVAYHVLEFAPKDYVWARVDLVQRDNGEVFLIEMDLIETTLYLTYCDTALNDFCKVILNQL